ncbi:DUF2871 domain-containing protein [Trueperella pecoris]|uniref:DUF2871 domain-containing protein n=1 Tax=Trueperella pecoris TaxID=2733571 RepID=A0A7M1QUF8_9ACTO|nr:DUF2871 domain-containing protein [Trueperella pecoris]QOQ39753.1 DUF2871 domain-containing protein [Trueperella pecoris]QOR45619.1 DUF2871 domain-containing protein [Trueperella pecoris]
MKNLWYLACAYAAVGLISGLVYRTMTMKMEVVPVNQLSTTHTHFLALGMMVMLIVLGLEATMKISQSRAFRVFCWTYNAGLILTGGVMMWHGIVQIGGGEGGPAIAGIAGVGHILLTVGIVSLLVSLAGPVKKLASERE